MFLSRIWNWLAADRRLILWSFAFGFIFTGLGIIPPLLVRQMIRGLEQPQAAQGFVWLALTVAGVYLLRGMSRYFYGLMSHIAAYRTLHRLTNAVYAHLQRQPPSYQSRRHSGGLVARTIGDVQAVEDFIAHGIPETLLAIVIPITMSVVLFLLNWKLAVIALLPLPIVAAAAYVLTTRVRNSWRNVRHRFAELSAQIQDHLSGLPVIQSFTAESAAASRIDRESRQYRDSIIHANTWSLLPAGLIEASSGAGLVLIVLSGIWMTGNGPMQIDVADLVVFLMYLGQIFLPFLRLANMTENLQKAAASAARVFDLLDEPPEIVGKPDATVPSQMRYDITFEQVDFSYESGSRILNGANFHVSEGETVALVGASGVGKTTACHLLVRFYDVDFGAVRLGSHNVRDLPLDFLRKQIALVSQDVFLFSGTIRDNLRLGNPDAGDEDIQAAARAARADEFILSFPDGYDTSVGERGIRLSGGQKQRIAIARALLKDSPVLVFDEATSAVDAESEAEIREAVHQATKGRTVLIVAHRVSTIRDADRIVVFKDGRVVETGTWNELVEQRGHLAEVCRLQEDAVW
ncbi:MAG: ABC transporter ATP-binding protein/permease [Fuerstiella sp.]|nr:ABC transporter ATP-binding protein/permease [Fuerstiella sp.]